MSLTQAIRKLRSFKRFIVAIVLVSSLWMMLILAVQSYGSGLKHHVLAYFKNRGIGITDADRLLSVWYSPNHIGEVLGRNLWWSPSGDELAFTVQTDSIERAEIHVLSMKGLGIRNLHAYVYGMNFTWSPDSRMIGFLTRPQASTSELRVVDAVTGNLLVHLNLPEIILLVWSPDGRMLAFGAGNQMRVMDVNTGRIIADLTQPIYEQSPSFWRWSPDNRWLAFASLHKRDPLYITLSLIDLNMHQVRDIFEPIDFSTTPPLWSPDSQYLAFSSVETIGKRTTSMVHILDVSSGEVHIVTSQDRSDEVLAWSPDNQVIVFLDLNLGAIYAVNRDDDEPRLLTPPNYQSVLFANLSPDGQKLAFLSSNTNMSDTLFVIDMETGSISPLVDHAIYPIWRP